MSRVAPFVLPLLLTTLPAQEIDEHGIAPPIAWQTDLTAARQLAAVRHAPLFVVLRCER